MTSVPGRLRPSSGRQRMWCSRGLSSSSRLRSKDRRECSPRDLDTNSDEPASGGLACLRQTFDAWNGTLAQPVTALVKKDKMGRSVLRLADDRPITSSSMRSIGQICGSQGGKANSIIAVPCLHERGIDRPEIVDCAMVLSVCDAGLGRKAFVVQPPAFSLRATIQEQDRWAQLNLLGTQYRVLSNPQMVRSTNCASTPFARLRWMPCRRLIPAIRVRRWRWRRWSIICGNASCASTLTIRSGPTAIASCYRLVTHRCCFTRYCT